MARRHGGIRVSPATAVIRADDENVLEDTRRPSRGQPGCAASAPTVLAARTKVDHVLDQLRVMGYAPVAESPDGEMVVKRPDVRRAPQPFPAAPPGLRSGDTCPRRARRGRARATRRRPSGRCGPRGSSGGGGRQSDLPPPGRRWLRHRGPADAGTMWIGYVDNSGTVSERLVDPVRLDGGFLRRTTTRGDPNLRPPHHRRR